MTVFLIEDSIDRIEASVAEMQKIMRKASRDLLGGFELRADCKPNDIVRYPDRFVDKREREDGMRHWNWLMTLIAGENDGQFTDRGYGDTAATAIRCKEEAQALQNTVGKT